ncbi:MAG TPA: HTTM domain-containing protein [Polyangiaceae bacterium]|nr:HTTM domain-containing protein [Polyangiaceae bacterium]
MLAQPQRSRFPLRFLERYPQILETYFSLDRRSLAIARIYLAGLLMWDVLRRIPTLETFYTNDGILPNHTVLWRPGGDWQFSLFFAASRPIEVLALFGIMLLFNLCFMVGYRTKLFHVLSLFMLLNMHNRAVFTENGGDVALNLLCLWTLFMPLGSRFSVDAILESLRQRRERTVEELNDRASIPRDTRPAVTLAVLAFLAQLSVVYYFNTVHKRGFTWRQGSAVYYVLFQERMVTWIGWKIRPIPLWLARFMSYTTLGIEATAMVLLLNPYKRVWTRRIAVVILPFMHLAFAALLNVGMFSFNMIGYFPILWSKEDWEYFAKRFRPQSELARTVYFDESSALGFAWARLLSRLDAFGFLTFKAIPSAEAEGTVWGIEDPATARRKTGAAALAACFAVLPCGGPVARALRLPGVSSAGAFIGRQLTNSRGLLLYLGAAPLGAPEIRRDNPLPSPARLWLWRRLAEGRELAVVLAIFVLGSQVLQENKAVPKQLKFGQFKWIQQLIIYPRLFQGWAMFTPDVATGERMLYIDGITADGRHIDPFNEAGSRVSTLPVEQVPPYMNQNEFWCDYTNRIPENQAYWRALKEWIFKYHERTGRPEDRIVSFEGRLLENDNPPPGEVGKRNFRTKVLMREQQ